MFAPFLHEQPKGAEPHRTRVPAGTGATRGSVGYHGPILSQGHVHSKHLSRLEWHSFVWSHKKLAWVFRAQPILWIVASLGAFILQRNRVKYLYEELHHHGQGRGLLPRNSLVSLRIIWISVYHVSVHNVSVVFLVKDSLLGLHMFAPCWLQVEIPHFLKKDS